GFMKFFGKISYGLYVFHWPIYLLLNSWLLSFAKNYFADFTARLSVSVFATAVAVIISWLSFQYFESYFLKLKSRYA
ncbi:MAG: acyltransferase family protein, partial [Chitinophagaceae bacterium]|nr:acyltransferase family protein [Chitinophagaceae bacterium]